MSETIKIVRWWWAWSPEKIENWLEDMEKRGWRLFNASFGAIVFYFEKDTPRTARYCLDYQDKINPEYKSIFEDAGWQYIYNSMGWHIWRREYQDVKPEIYTDLDSIIQRNSRQIRMLLAVFAAQIPILTVDINKLKLNYISPFTVYLFIIYFAVLLILFYAIIKITRYNKTLIKKKNKTL